MSGPLVFLALLAAACSPARRAASGDDPGIPAETYAKFRNNLFLAEKLAEYDRLAWEATDSIQKFKGILAPGEVNGYVVERFRDSTLVAFGTSIGSEGFVKFCQVVFSDSGIRPVLFDSGRTGTGNEKRLYAVFADARRELGEREYSLGKHNFYVLPGEDTTWVYAIPGFRKGEHVFGGSYRYAYLAGRLAGKKAFHLGYQYVKDKRKAIDVGITSDLDEVPNECDLLKFLAYRGIFREMRIRTSKYVFKLVHKPAGGIDFTAAPKT